MTGQFFPSVFIKIRKDTFINENGGKQKTDLLCKHLIN